MVIKQLYFLKKNKFIGQLQYPLNIQKNYKKVEINFGSIDYWWPGHTATDRVVYSAYRGLFLYISTLILAYTNYYDETRNIKWLQSLFHSLYAIDKHCGMINDSRGA